MDKSWRSPGWNSWASFSPSFPQALRKTLRLSWTKNKTRMRFVHLQRQKNNHSRILWQGHSLQLNASKVHLTRGQTRMGRSMGGANKKQPSAEHTNTCSGERLRDRSWLTAAKLPVGQVLGGDEAKTRKHDIRIMWKAHPKQAMWMHRDWAPAHTLKLPPSLPAKPFSVWKPAISVELRIILETLGCYKTKGWVTHIYFCLEASGHRSGRTTFCVNHLKFIA